MSNAKVLKFGNFFKYSLKKLLKRIEIILKFFFISFIAISLILLKSYQSYKVYNFLVVFNIWS
jgi:hypothetical protein